jgi:hypothetical protein
VGAFLDSEGNKLWFCSYAWLSSICQTKLLTCSVATKLRLYFSETAPENPSVWETASIMRRRQALYGPAKILGVTRPLLIISPPGTISTRFLTIMSIADYVILWLRIVKQDWFENLGPKLMHFAQSLIPRGELSSTICGPDRPMPGPSPLVFNQAAPLFQSI